MKNTILSHVKPWFGASGIVALAVFVLGRLAVEPLRDLPHFDDGGMDPYCTVETFQLRKDTHPVKVGIFGSSVTLWGVLPEVVASELHEDAFAVRKLASPGGTPFDVWNLVRRNPEKFKELRVAVLELNPLGLHEALEGDFRLEFSLSQRATWHERALMHKQSERLVLEAEWLMPFVSVRRPLSTLFLNARDPGPQDPVYSHATDRLYPGGGWQVVGLPQSSAPPKSMSNPEKAAYRWVGRWRVSKIQDEAMKQLLSWFKEHNVKLVFHQMPVHPDIVAAFDGNPRLREGYDAYGKYLTSLGIRSEDMLRCFDLKDCGVPVEGMRDYTHMNEIGAKIYSKVLARHVSQVTSSMTAQHTH